MWSSHQLNEVCSLCTSSGGMHVKCASVRWYAIVLENRAKQQLPQPVDLEKPDTWGKPLCQVCTYRTQAKPGQAFLDTLNFCIPWDKNNNLTLWNMKRGNNTSVIGVTWTDKPYQSTTKKALPVYLTDKLPVAMSQGTHSVNYLWIWSQ